MRREIAFPYIASGRASRPCSGEFHAFTGNDVTSRIGIKHAAMQCNPIVYLTGFDNRAELPETVIAPVKEYLLLGWAGARSKPSSSKDV